ncbi:MAG TPA: PilZ domain-containing protein [Candidatus Acidoferrum sp.]|nr:PilZ domain-containing protein [Candidatus Acidoferrum sp.]
MAERSKVKHTESEMALVHQSERREERFALPFEIEVSGINGEGEVFHMSLKTRNASEWGCGFLSPIEMKKDDIVAIRVASPDGPGAVQRLPVRFQVVHVERETGGWAIGAWKMESDDVWGIELEMMAQPQGGEAMLRRRGVADEENEKGDE